MIVAVMIVAVMIVDCCGCSAGAANRRSIDDHHDYDLTP